jgi:hypothetical protein
MRRPPKTEVLLLALKPTVSKEVVGSKSSSNNAAKTTGRKKAFA